MKRAIRKGVVFQRSPYFFEDVLKISADILSSIFTFNIHSLDTPNHIFPMPVSIKFQIF